MGHQARVVAVLMVLMGRVPPDVAPASFKEAQLRIVEDVEVSSAQAVTRRPDEEIAVVLHTLPPHGEVERAAAELQARRHQRMTENLPEGNRTGGEKD